MHTTHHGSPDVQGSVPHSKVKIIEFSYKQQVTFNNQSLLCDFSYTVIVFPNAKHVNVFNYLEVKLTSYGEISKKATENSRNLDNSVWIKIPRDFISKTKKYI
jgi:hypothetical protein